VITAATDLLVTTQALFNADARVLLDTVPPKMVYVDSLGVEYLEFSADRLLASANGDDGTDDLFAPFPNLWGPAQPASVLTSQTPVNSGLVGGTAGGVPQVFLNPQNDTSTPFDFTVRVQFRDLLPGEAEGNPRPVTTSGFAQELLDAQFAVPVDTSPGSVLNSVQLGANAVAVLQGALSNSNLRATDRVDFGATILSDTLTATWAFSLLPTVGNFTDSTTGYATGYWRTPIQPVAVDRACNQTPSGPAAIVWWMPPVPALVTPRLTGGTVEAPSFSVSLARSGNVPTDASPSDPLYSARLWVANGVDARNTDWTAFDGGITNPSDPSLTGDLARQEAVAMRTWRPTGTFMPSATLLSDPRLLDRLLLLTVYGADEAGNAQPQGFGTQLLNITTALGYSELGQPQQNFIDYAYWLNPGTTDSLSSEVSATFFWDNNGNGLLDRGDIALGSGPELPQPPVDYIDNSPVLKGILNINFRSPIASDTDIKTELYEEGVKVGENLPYGATVLSNPLRLTIPLDLQYGLLGDPRYYVAETKAQARRVNYTVVVQVTYRKDEGDGTFTETTELTKSTIAFTVVPPGDVATEEQPIKTFERQ
jgi:hypothetical protein